MARREKPFETVLGKGENAGDHCFFLFPQCSLPTLLNHFPNNKMLDTSILKKFADDKINVTQNLKFWSRKHCGKRRKCWLSAFSPFPTMFQKAFDSVRL